jgi:hypothetical protein
MYTIKADNPKGLAFEYATDDPKQAANVTREFVRRGGINVTVNGVPLPESLYSEA